MAQKIVSSELKSAATVSNLHTERAATLPGVEMCLSLCFPFLEPTRCLYHSNKNVMHMSNHLKYDKRQKCKKGRNCGRWFPINSILYQECLFHNVNTACQVTCQCKLRRLIEAQVNYLLEGRQVRGDMCS